MFKRELSSRQLAKESGKVLDIFTSTVVALTTINGAAQECIDDNERKKAEIEKELCALKDIKDKNEIVINKIEKIFV